MNESNPKFPLFIIEQVPDFNPQKILGYYAISTAKINVEDRQRLPMSNSNSSSTLEKIASYLINSPSPTPEISIFIHGYANTNHNAKERTNEIYTHAVNTCQPKTQVLFGYLWPAENPIKDDSQQVGPPVSFLDKMQYALQALPTSLIGTFVITILLFLVSFILALGLVSQAGIISYILIGIIVLIVFIAARVLLQIGEAQGLLPWLPIIITVIAAITTSAACLLSWISQSQWQQILLSVNLSFFGFWFTIILALILLRLSTYLRDQYRAATYAVLDLVDLIRQLDLVLTETFKKETLENSCVKPKKIQLNFIAHSMGCFVTTNVIRILSDVFDPGAVDERPDSSLGHNLCLSRLVLVAADIPTESIMPGRSNVLQSSLRRCKEAYLFTNEGDLALRLASTAVNYFSFPSRTRFNGYRLGNLTAKHFEKASERGNKKLKSEQYGIINWNNSQKMALDTTYKFLEIRSSNQEHRNLEELNSEPLRYRDEPFDTNSLVNGFTVFDCTDYQDYKLAPGTDPQPNDKMGPIVTRAIRRKALNLFNYFRLTIDFLVTTTIDTHGGYFEGQFSQQLIYDLTLLGFEATLEKISSQPLTIQNRWELLSQFEQICQQKQLQVILSSKESDFFRGR